MGSKAIIGGFPNYFFIFLLFYVPQTHKKNLLPGMMCQTGEITHGAAVIVLFVTVTPQASCTADIGSA